jgi:hypothetical protein
VRVSYLEIYNEELRDLLVAFRPPGPTSSTSRDTNRNNNRNPRRPAAAGPPSPPPPPLELREDSEGKPLVRNLTSVPVRSAAECRAALEAGRRLRTTGATNMNRASSRSHAVFTVTVEAADGVGGAAAADGVGGAAAAAA